MHEITSPLETHLKERILKEGELSLSSFMEEALYHPQYGYYTTQNPFNDFTTAPEITPLFGEIIAIWIIQTWHKMGSPHPFSLIECGPGKGTLMSDVLRTLKKVAMPCFKAALPTLVETSPKLTTVQQNTLKEYQNIQWYKNIQEVPNNQPTILIANELLDAFPINQYQHTPQEGWQERCITFNNTQGLHFIFKSPQNLPKYFSTITPTNDTIYEYSESQINWITCTEGHFKKHPFSALLIDYAIPNGDTLQALQQHQFVNPLHNIGKQDLTTHVNFPLLQQHLKNPESSELVDLSTFLTQYGFSLRITTLLEQDTISEDTKKELYTVAERLLSPQHMGTLFKCFSFRNF